MRVMVQFMIPGTADQSVFVITGLKRLHNFMHKQLNLKRNTKTNIIILNLIKRLNLSMFCYKIERIKYVKYKIRKTKQTNINK